MAVAGTSPSFIASLAVILLCLYFGYREASRGGICQMVFADQPGVASTAQFMGTKTPYSFLHHIKRGAPFQTERDLDGCQAMKLYAVLRHGARYATAKRAAETGRLKATILSRLGPQVANHQCLSIRLRPSSRGHNDLSQVGMKEQFCLAIRLKSKFPSLLEETYSMEYYHFRSSQTSRSFKSALSFGAGLFQGEGPLDGYQPINVEVKPVEEDNLLRFDEHDCPRYDNQVTSNKTLMADFDKLLTSPSMLAVKEHIQMKLDPGHVCLSDSLPLTNIQYTLPSQVDQERLNFTIKDMLTLYKLCVDETVESLYVSHWCHLISPRHLATLHQYHNIKSFWKKGTGVPITGLRSVHLVKDIVDFFNSNSTIKVSFKFGHSETLLPLLAFLDVPFSGLRHFDTTFITPFSANAIFILYNCSSHAELGLPRNQLFVSLLVNESPVELNLCPDEARRERRGLCPLKEIEKAAAHKSSGWSSLKQLCTSTNL